MMPGQPLTALRLCAMSATGCVRSVGTVSLSKTVVPQQQLSTFDEARRLLVEPDPEEAVRQSILAQLRVTEPGT